MAQLLSFHWMDVRLNKWFSLELLRLNTSSNRRARLVYDNDELPVRSSNSQVLRDVDEEVTRCSNAETLETSPMTNVDNTMDNQTITKRYSCFSPHPHPHPRRITSTDRRISPLQPLLSGRFDHVWAEVFSCVPRERRSSRRGKSPATMLTERPQKIIVPMETPCSQFRHNSAEKRNEMIAGTPQIITLLITSRKSKSIRTYYDTWSSLWNLFTERDQTSE